MRAVSAIAIAVIASHAVAADPKPVTAPVNGDAPLCKPVEREAVYEFAREPTVRKQGEQYAISFACKGKCDVAVAVEDASGRILRHIVYGVLGSNAPPPLKKDPLEQTLFWDGKDEFGKYVKDVDKCRVRVSLGLNPTFDKNIGWHPKDTSTARNLSAIAADADGVYVLECLAYGSGTLRKYDHDGNYLRTLYPWDPEKLDRINIPMRTLRDAKIWPEKPKDASRAVPVKATGRRARLATFTTTRAWRVRPASLRFSPWAGSTMSAGCCGCARTARPAVSRSKAAASRRRPLRSPVRPTWL